MDDIVVVVDSVEISWAWMTFLLSMMFVICCVTCHCHVSHFIEIITIESMLDYEHILLDDGIPGGFDDGM